VRQRAEDEVDGFEFEFPDRRERRQLERGEMREDVGHRLPGLAVGGERPDRDARMAREQADQLRAGVARGSEDRDVEEVGHGRVQ
jgi:hypothetical protein